MRKRRLFGLGFGLAVALACGLSLGVGKLPAQPPPPAAKDNEAPGKGQRAKEFIAAFEKGDAKAVAAFWTENADYVDQIGRQYKGRAAIETMYEKLFAGKKGMKLNIIVISARMVGTDVALEDGITDGLGNDEPRVRPDRGAELVERARLHERRGDAEARQRVCQEIDGAAIERGRRHDVVAGIHQRRDAQVHRRHAARGADRADAVLQRRQPLLEHRGRRVRNAGIDVSGAFQVEQRRRMVGILKHIGSGLVDRNCARAGGGIGMLARMQAQGFKGGRFRCWHGGWAVAARPRLAAYLASPRRLPFKRYP